MAFLIGGANSAADTAFSVDNSCRFDGSSAYMTLTPGSAGSQVTQTYSVWVKRSKLGDEEFIMYARKDADDDTRLYFENDTLRFQCTVNNTTHTRLWTNRVFRDPSAWYHIVISYDSSVSTPSTSSVQMFINGVKETSFSATIYPSQNDVSYWCDDSLHTIGRRSDGTSNYYNGYMAEAVLIDGLALTASSFGEFDEDSPTIWKPKDVSGLSFGTNGFYCDFEDSANLGNDANGGTDLTEVNLAATDQASDSPTNNFATWNPLTGSANLTYSEGNTKATSAGSGTPWRHATSSIAVASGKWYFEVKKGGSDAQLCSVADAESSTSNQDNDFNELIAYDSSDGNKRVGGTSSSYGDSYANGDIVGIALDMTNQFVYFSKNGTWQNSGDPTSGATGTGGISTSSYSLLYFDVAQSESHSVEANFGNPSFTVSSANQDANGYGNFEYAPPSGYYALCTKNLAEFG